jgi:adenine deaminase
MGFLSGLFGGGIGNSQSSQTNKTDSTDMSVVGGADSTNTSQKIQIDGSGNTVSLTDGGAVSGALKLALAGVESVTHVAQDTVAQQSHLLDGALETLSTQSTQHAADLARIKTGDTQTIVLAGAAVLAIGLYALIKKG